MLFSVVIPTCHRNDLLAKCLDRLAPGQQTLSPNQYEVIVTDDGVKATAEQLIREKYPWARWVQGPRKGPGANRNNGSRLARGEWLAFVDDDCLPDSAWLFSIAEALHQKDLEVVEGKTVIPDKVDNPFRMGVENLHGGVYWSCNLVFKKSTFFKIGAFDEDFLQACGEDLELAFRIRKNQLKAFFCEQARVLHPVRRLSIKGFLWRIFSIRWMRLYYLKTNSKSLKCKNIFLIIIQVLSQELMRSLRVTWHFFSRSNPKERRIRLFWIIWLWLIQPVILPYLVYWEFRFRKLMFSKKELSNV